MAPRKLNIAFIGGRGVGGTYSGIETYYEEVGSRLAARGHQVSAYCRNEFTPDVSTYRGIRIRRLPTIQSKHLETLTHSILSTVDSFRHSFDIIQYHAIGSAPLAWIPRMAGRSTIVSVRGLDWQRAKWGRIARWSLQFGEWASIRCPVATVVVSDTLQRHYLEVHGRETRVIPNAVVSSVARAPDAIRAFGLERDSYVLFAGRLSPEKGIHTLLEAFRPLGHEKKLVIAGGGSYTDDYVRSIRAAASDNVQFLGQVGRSVMEELYSNCYAFVLPSVMEGRSIALLEALSYENCIVCSDIPENLEVVGTAGLVCPPGDAIALRELLARLVASPSLAKQYKKLAAERLNSLPDWDEIARMTEELYLELAR